MTSRLAAASLRAYLARSPYSAIRQAIRHADPARTESRLTPRLYELFALQEVVRSLAARFAGTGWEPRFPDDPASFFRHPFFRLGLPQQLGELIWKPAYPNARGLPIRSLSHLMRPDLVIDGPRGLLVLDAKHRFGEDVTRILDELHAYRDALVDSKGKEVVRLAVALTAGSPGRSTRRYYALSFLHESGLGLTHLPPPGGDPPEAGSLRISEVWDLYLSGRSRGTALSGDSASR